MSYRSVWTLAVGGKNATGTQFQELIAYMEYMAKLNKTEDTELFEFILGCKCDDTTPKLMVFNDKSTKCYDPWDAVIGQITTKAEGIGLDWAYACVGEDYADMTQNSNCGSVYLPLIRNIGKPEVM